MTRGTGRVGLHLPGHVDQKALWTHRRMLPFAGWKRGCVAVSPRQGRPRWRQGNTMQSQLAVLDPRREEWKGREGRWRRAQTEALVRAAVGLADGPGLALGGAVTWPRSDRPWLCTCRRSLQPLYLLACVRRTRAAGSPARPWGSQLREETLRSVCASSSGRGLRVCDGLERSAAQ